MGLKNRMNEVKYSIDNKLDNVKQMINVSYFGKNNSSLKIQDNKEHRIREEKNPIGLVKSFNINIM